MNYKHGHCPVPGKRSSTLETWHDMLRRTTDPKRRSYHRYGGRGISVCDRWQDFKNFFEDMGEKPNGMSLERIDNAGNYEPSNCRWATAKEQARNRRTSKLITFNNETKPLATWCEELGLNYIRTLGRINNCKWSIEKAFAKRD